MFRPYIVGEFPWPGMIVVIARRIRRAEERELRMGRQRLYCQVFCRRTDKDEIPLHGLIPRDEMTALQDERGMGRVEEPRQLIDTVGLADSRVVVDQADISRRAL